MTMSYADIGPVFPLDEVLTKDVRNTSVTMLEVVKFNSLGKTPLVAASPCIDKGGEKANE